MNAQEEEVPPPPPDYDAPYEQPAVQPPPAYQQPPPQQAYPAPRDWRPGDPVPPGYQEVSEPRRGLIVGGSLVFGIPYLTSLLVGVIAIDLGGANLWPMLLPVVGPFIQLAIPPDTFNALLVLDGVLQVGGVAMFIAGFAAPVQRLVKLRYGSLEVMPVPLFSAHSGTGLGFAGAF